MGKLTTIFENQFLGWAKSAGFKNIADITAADLEAFRDIWTDGPLAKKKKQERIIGFFYYCVRLGWIKSNPAVLLGRIKADGPPTDCFPKQEFDHIVDTTYIYQPKGWKENASRLANAWVMAFLRKYQRGRHEQMTLPVLAPKPIIRADDKRRAS